MDEIFGLRQWLPLLIAAFAVVMGVAFWFNGSIVHPRGRAKAPTPVTTSVRALPAGDS